MGGIGTAAIAVPAHRISSAAAWRPLGGYPGYFVRRDVFGRPIRPWARLLAAERSNVDWAENGENLPLWIGHGTQDLPEANSGVLIDRYEQLGYSMKDDHPNLGHNVWQSTYEGMKGARWLLSHARVAHPPPRPLSDRLPPRRRRHTWLHVSELGRAGHLGRRHGGRHVAHERDPHDERGPGHEARPRPGAPRSDRGAHGDGRRLSPHLRSRTSHFCSIGRTPHG